jgi:hypothetical protein
MTPGGGRSAAAGSIPRADARGTGLAAWAAVILPALVAIVLCLQRVGLGYFWDDYVFLTDARSNALSNLLPVPGYPFYRPIPRWALVHLLLPLGTGGALAAHLVNLALFALSCSLLAWLARSLAGPAAGLLAGLAFAAFGPAPALVAWASGSQDLLAIAFVLAALCFRHAGRPIATAAAFAGALLSKEAAVLFLPLLVFWDRLVAREPDRAGRNALLSGSAALVWLAFHPAVRVLLFGPARGGTESYVGLASVREWAPHLARYVLTLFDLPVTGLATPWPPELSGAGAAAAALGFAGLWLVRARGGRRAAVPGPSLKRVAGIAALIAIPQLLLVAVLVRLWLPYFTCIAALGGALWIGVALARAPLGAAACAYAAILALGVWFRGMDVRSEPVYTERTFVQASDAARRLERNWKELWPELARDTQVSLSIAATGRLGITQTMLTGQALRVWYDDPTLITVRPERHRADGRPELLARITSDLSVVEIDPDSLRFRWAGSDTLELQEIDRPIRTYWRGAAASGQVDRAVAGLLRLAARDGPDLGARDRRVAAMALLAAGRRDEAAKLLAGERPYPKGEAIQEVLKLLSETSGDAAQDSSAFPAFGLSASDPGVARILMHELYADGHLRQAAHFARRLSRARPGDVGSAEILHLAGEGLGPSGR